MTTVRWWLFSLSLALGAAACQSEQSMALRVFTPDGGDPWVGDDAATQARLRVEDRETPVQTVSVGRGGSFSLQVELVRPDLRSRIVVEALRNGEVVGSGGTPLAQWASFGPTLMPIWVQWRDSVVPAPWGEGARRVRPFLFELQSPYVAAVGGALAAAAVDVFDALVIRRVEGASAIEDTFNRDASALRLADGSVLLVRGCVAAVWNPANNTVTTPTGRSAPQERCDIIGSATLQEPGGGGLVLGGRNATSAVARVDRVMPDGTWVTAEALTTPRDQPSVLRLGELDALVAGGQGATADYLERYGPMLMAAQRTVHTGDERVDRRSRAALVMAGDGVALALGGVVAGSDALATEDALLDTRCATGGCRVLLGVRPLLSQRRRDATAALAEGDRVLVASGTGSDGRVADAVEILDVSAPRNPQAGVAVASLPYEGLSMLPLTTGSVWIVGGGRSESWLYRH
ncbi:MAG: hypothetical protein IPF99_07115 [Deltaproteobacteria bacterium]|nr:hypothetical protein [Deltaproteobacteria bacterium]